MKLAIILAILLILIGVYLIVQDSPHTISGTQELVLNEQDLQQLEMTSAMSFNGNDCQTEEQTSFSSSPVQYSICNYTINSLSDTWVVIELKKFTKREDLNDAYQYDSSHLFGAKGLISENTYGDQSRFRVNSEDDYGAEFNEPGVYYYHLWVCKNEYLIHITSKGSNEAREYIENIGQRILSKFR